MAKRTDKYIGKEATHSELGKVKVLKAVPKSRTLVEVECIDRGAGWDDFHKKYVGVQKGNGWTRAENKEFGKKDEVHYKELKL